MNRRKRQRLLNTVLTIIATILFLTPIYMLVHEHVDDMTSDGTGHQALDTQFTKALRDGTKPCEYLEPVPAHSGTLSDEKERFVRHLNEITTNCEHIQLLGKPNQKRTKESQNLRATSYICLGGKMGLERKKCLVYSFGIKYPWDVFSELAQNELGCSVYVFEPAADFIDHYHSKNIRFFNARLSNIDQQAQYKVPGENGWKYSKFLTILREKHFTKKPIDVLRLDVTLDLWKGLSTMLSDGSLLLFVKQLAMEFDIANKNTTEIRQMFGMVQWLNRQGFQLVHSQATRTSGASYAVTYINSKIANSSESVPIGDAPEVAMLTSPKPNPKVAKKPPSVQVKKTEQKPKAIITKKPPNAQVKKTQQKPKATIKPPAQVKKNQQKPKATIKPPAQVKKTQQQPKTMKIPPSVRVKRTQSITKRIVLMM